MAQLTNGHAPDSKLPKCGCKDVPYIKGTLICNSHIDQAIRTVQDQSDQAHAKAQELYTQSEILRNIGMDLDRSRFEFRNPITRTPPVVPKTHKPPSQTSQKNAMLDALFKKLSNLQTKPR